MPEINFYNVDCIEFMKSKPDKCYDLAIVDPPYGINVKTRIFDDGKQWDTSIPNQEYFNELFRVSKNQIIWGGNYFTEFLRNTPCIIIWDKKMTEDHLMSMLEMAWTSFDGKSMIFRQPPVGERGFYNIDGKRIHPTQKSIKLYRWLLHNYAKEGDKILDTHGGSMSSAIACDMEGFDLDICEIDKDYFDDALKRFNNYKRQLVMFKDY